MYLLQKSGRYRDNTANFFTRYQILQSISLIVTYLWHLGQNKPNYGFSTFLNFSVELCLRCLHDNPDLCGLLFFCCIHPYARMKISTTKGTIPAWGIYILSIDFSDVYKHKINFDMCKIDGLHGRWNIDTLVKLGPRCIRCVVLFLLNDYTCTYTANRLYNTHLYKMKYVL